MKKVLLAVLLAMVVAIGTASAANYIYMKVDGNGVGYLKTDFDAQTTNKSYTGLAMSEIDTGTGLISKYKHELTVSTFNDATGSAGVCREYNNYIDEKKEVDFEYMPIVYQNESYDFKWTEKKCVKNYIIGSVVDAFFEKAEKLQKTEEAKANATFNTMNVVASVAGKAHIGVKSVDPDPNDRTTYFEGYHEWTGIFNIDSYIETRENCSVNAGVTDWLGCP